MFVHYFFHLCKYIFFFLGCLSGFTCSLCKKWFSSKITLTKHKIWHHKEGCGRFRYNCDICPYGSEYHTNMKKHAAVHSRDRPFECCFCGNRFCTSASLNQHIVIHTGESQETFLFLPS